MKTDFILDEGAKKEDTYLIKDNIFGVFDGFNSLDRFYGKEGKSGGQIASAIAKEIFSRNNKNLKSLAMEANQKIREVMIDNKIDFSNNRNVWGTIFAVGRIKDRSLEWIQIGNSLILLIYMDDSFKILIDDYDFDKWVLKIWKKLAEEKKENIRELIDKGPMTENRNNMNKTYGCLNGEEKAISFLRSGKEDLKDVKHILFFTDGLFLPKENPEADDDWNKFVNLYLEGGLKNIKDYIRNLEKEDPKCWKYPRFKQYDDIAAVSIGL